MGHLLNIPGARFDSRTRELDLLVATLRVLCEAGVVLGTVQPDVMVSRHGISGKPPRVKCQSLDLINWEKAQEKIRQWEA